MRKVVNRRVPFVLSVVLFALVEASAFGEVYSLTDMGELPDALYAMVEGVNEYGHATGYCRNSVDEFHAFLWQEGAGMADIGQFMGQDLNNAGQVVGYVSSPSQAFLWDPVGGMQDLGDLPGGLTGSRAMGLNETGQVAGFSYAATGFRAFLWDEVGGMQNLGDLPGGLNKSLGYEVNDLGHVVGCSEAESGQRAFIWDAANGMQDLGELEGAPDHYYAHSINNQDQVVGYAGTGQTDNIAFIWDALNGMQDLGHLPGGIDYSQAYDINELAQVVGCSYLSASDSHAFIWDESLGMRDLNLLLDEPGTGYTLFTAKGINNQGQIVAYGRTPTGMMHSFLLTPVPEPATVWLLALAGVLVSTKRR